VFETLTDRFDAVFAKLKGRGRLAESDVNAAMRGIRVALLEADVSFDVVRAFTERVRGRALGAETSKALNPGQQVVKIVLSELTAVLGGSPLTVKYAPKPPTVVLLAGLQGTGKTTTLRAISGLEPVCAGRVRYRGLDITHTPPTWRVGMGLHQIVGGEAVATGLTVEDNLRLFSHSVIGPRADAGIAAALRRFPRLEERRSQSAATLSGGEKQMLALAKAFIVEPRLLMIDEFSLGLAPALVAELVPVVRSIAERGAAVLLVEQSMNVVHGLADYAYVMDKGEIRSEGPTADWEMTGDLVRSVYLAGSRNLSGSRDRVNSPERTDPLRPGGSVKLEQPS